MTKIKFVKIRIWILILFDLSEAGFTTNTGGLCGFSRKVVKRGNRRQHD